MARSLTLIVALLACVVARAGEPENDFKPVTVDGEDVAAVSRDRLGRGTSIRVRLLARGKGGSVRLGQARTLDAGVAAMTEWSAMAVNASYSERLRADAYVAVAAGPKDAPLKLEKVDTDAATGATKLTFEGGMVVEVTLTGPGGATSRPR